MFKIGFMQGRLVKSEKKILFNHFMEKLKKEFVLQKKQKLN